MQPGMKAVVAVLVVALIAVIGLIVISQGNSAQKPAPTVTATPETTAALEQEPEATAELAQGDDAAQDTMYEGALAGLTEEEIAKVEDIVNEQIQAALPVVTEVMDLEEAKKTGAMALFGEKYSEKVRVVCMGDFSKEICGGPHATNTGDLKSFKIQKEESSSAGVRRIKAVIGTTAEDETPIL